MMRLIDNKKDKTYSIFLFQDSSDSFDIVINLETASLLDQFTKKNYKVQNSLQLNKTS